MARRADPLAVRALRRLGETLRERYRIDRLIGIGGMAAVYAGVHRNGHPVAIKILHDGMASDPEIERLFRREAQLANTVGHPGVVPVIDDDVTEDGCVFLVMPLLYGETLRARAERSDQKLPLVEVIVLAHEILTTLAAAHAKRIVHRDIKPENVFVTVGGDVRVLDFGIGRFFEAKEGRPGTRSGRALGTPAFMAPEQALGRHREVDGRTDLWALSATMFSLLSGRFVHEAETATEMAVLAATQAAPSLLTVAPDVPAQIRAVIDRGLAFQKDERWADASIMAHALQGACELLLSGPIDSLPRVIAPEHTLASTSDDLRTQHLQTGTQRPVPTELHGNSDGGAVRDPKYSPRTETYTISGAAGTSDSPGAISRRARMLALPLVGAAIIGVIAFVQKESSSRAPHLARSEQEAAPAADASRLRAMKLFSAGMQAWRDAARIVAAESFQEATDEDPSLAVAHLMYVFQDDWPSDDARAHFQKATQYRQSLSDAQNRLLEAMAFALQVPADQQEANIRLTEALNHYPHDLPIAYAKALTCIKLGYFAEALHVIDSVLRDTPKLPIALYQRSSALLFSLKTSEARNALQDCLRASPGATSCMSNLCALDANDGRCDEAEKVAHQLIEVYSKSPVPFSYLAAASYGAHGVIEGARVALQEGLSALPSGSSARNAASHQANAKLAVLTGDFESATRETEAWGRALDEERDEDVHAVQSQFFMELMLETGDAHSVRVEAQRFLSTRSAWTPDPYEDFRIEPLVYEYRAGVISHDDFERERRGWLQAEETRPPLLEQNGFRWIRAFADAVVTRQDAHEAVQSRPSYEPLPDALARLASHDTSIGRVYLIENDVDSALPYLRRAAMSCTAVDEPIQHTRAQLLLGQALETRGAIEDACHAYEVVLKRWATATHSTTASTALQRATALRCKVAALERSPARQ